MTIAESMLAEFEQEAAITRKFLERLPEDQLNWKPHEKSMSAGELALHLATSPGALIEMAKRDECSIPDFGEAPPRPANCQEVLSALDESIATVRRVLPSLDDRRIQATWKLVDNGREIMAVPRVAFIRSVLFNHWYHHRGQFGVYLRLLGVKVPATYGPSTDEIPEWVKK